MAISPINPLPVPPTQATPEAQWPDMADATVTAEYNLVLQLNAETIPGINQAVEDVESGAVESGANAEAAQLAATQAGQSKDAAAASAGAAAGSAGDAESSATAAAGSAVSASSSAGAAAGSAGAAEAFKSQAEEFRDEAQQFRDEAQEIVIGQAIDDTAMTPTQVRSSLNDSIGNFRNVQMSASGVISPLDFAQITATGAAVTVTLPATPLEGQIVMIGNLTERLDHRVAVGTSKVKAQAAAGFVLIDKPCFTITLKYISAEYGWEVMQ